MWKFVYEETYGLNTEFIAYIHIHIANVHCDESVLLIVNIYLSLVGVNQLNL